MATAEEDLTIGGTQLQTDLDFAYQRLSEMREEKEALEVALRTVTEKVGVFAIENEKLKTALNDTTTYVFTLLRIIRDRSL